MTTPRENFRLTPEQERELQSLAEMPDAEIDFSDIPLTTDWSNARRGVFYEAMLRQGVRPPEPPGARLTDTTERGLEDRIVRLLTDGRGDAANAGEISERPAAYSAGWMAGDPADYDRGNCVDLKQLSAFLVATQPNVAAALALDSDNPTRRQFLDQAEARDSQPWRHRRTAERRQSPAAPCGRFLRRPDARQHRRRGPLRSEPFLRYPPTAVQQR